MLCLPFFQGQNISSCNTTGRKLMFFFFFFFFLGGGGVSLSTFFTDKKFVYFFHSKNVSFCNSICRHWMFLNVYLFMLVYFFHVLVPCLPIFTERVLRSLIPYGKTLLFIMFTFFKDWYHVYHVQDISFYYTKGRKFKGSSCLLFHACLPFSLVKNFSFCKVREISRQA